MSNAMVLENTTSHTIPTNTDDFQGFGPHLMMDCWGINVDKASDVNFVWQFLDELPNKIGMHKIIPPYVFPYSGLVPEDKGVTGTVIIAESHLTFHSFTEKDYFFFDCFSCKPFDVSIVVKELLEAFDVKHHELHYANRGRTFPRYENAAEAATKTQFEVSAKSPIATPKYAGSLHPEMAMAEMTQPRRKELVAV